MTGKPRSAPDPFAVLGLHADGDLTDDDVRIAWRRIAEATHPDRADGGDPDRFALAAAAYTELRTGFGRNEARAELTGSGPARAPIVARFWRVGSASVLLRMVVAAAAAVLGGTAADWDTAAAPAIVVGALTWFLVSSSGPARYSLRLVGKAETQPGSGPVAMGLEGSNDHSDHEPT